MGPRVGLGVWKKTESLAQTGNGTRLPWSSSTWSRHYIDYASLAKTACTRNVFGTGSSMQPVAVLVYEQHDVFGTGSSMQPVAVLVYERYDVFGTGSSMQPVAVLVYERHDVFGTGGSMQPVAVLVYERQDVFGTGSSMQPVAAISFISAALFVHPKVSGRKVTREV